MNNEPASFIVMSPVNVRFADIDVMGHVNNAVYLSYFEEARIAFFEKLIGDNWNWTDHGILVARNEIDYKVPIVLSDRPRINTWCSRIGTTSLTIHYEVLIERNSHELIACTGSTVIVCYDYRQKKTMEVPLEWRQRIMRPTT